MYTWKINMKNGDSFIVRSDKNKTNEFMNELLGLGNVGITITCYELLNSIMYDDLNYTSNSVVILNTEVSSVEYLGNNN